MSLRFPCLIPGVKRFSSTPLRAVRIDRFGEERGKGREL